MVKVISIYKAINRSGEIIYGRASKYHGEEDIIVGLTKSGLDRSGSSKLPYPAVLSLSVFSVSSLREYLIGTMLESSTKAKPATKVVMVAPIANIMGK